MSLAKLGNVNARGGKGGGKRAEGAGSPSVQVEVIGSGNRYENNILFNECCR